MRRLLLALVAIAAVLAAGAYGLRAYSKSTTHQIAGDIVSHGPRDRPRVAVTLDDGPSPRYTAEVLEILARANAPATFYLTGHEVARRPELVTAIAEAGHEIGNHSFTHDRLVLLGRERIEDELAQTDAWLRGAGYDGPLTFRPPYGSKLWVLPRVLAREGRLTVMWDVALEADGDTAPAYAARIVEAAQPGSIILMHVMYQSREVDRAALALVIDGLRARGFELVTVTELLEG
ncbi:MAG: polysaccharide deacetylase family protein [Pseudomonadota bacterium]